MSQPFGKINTVGPPPPDGQEALQFQQLLNALRKHRTVHIHDAAAAALPTLKAAASKATAALPGARMKYHPDRQILELTR